MGLISTQRVPQHRITRKHHQQERKMTPETSMRWDHTSPHVQPLTRDQSGIIATLLHQNPGRTTPLFKVSLRFELNTPVKCCDSIVHLLMLSSRQTHSDRQFQHLAKLTSVILLILQISVSTLIIKRLSGYTAWDPRATNTSGQVRNKKRASIAEIKYKKKKYIYIYTEVQRWTAKSKGNGTKQEWPWGTKARDETGRGGNRTGQEADKESRERTDFIHKSWFTCRTQVIAGDGQETERECEVKQDIWGQNFGTKQEITKPQTQATTRKCYFCSEEKTRDEQKTTDRKSNTQNV